MRSHPARGSQKQLSKEFVREWLMDNGFQGREGEVVPEMTDDIVADISARYIELYENITGEKFRRATAEGAERLEEMEENIKNMISRLH